MKEITIEKSKVLEALVKNREAYKKDYELALEGYRVSVLVTMESYLKEFKELSLSEVIDFSPVPAFAVKPQNYITEYDMAMQMLELEMSDTIIVSNRDFKKYFMNQWDWYDTWAYSNQANMGIGSSSPDSKFYISGN